MARVEIEAAGRRVVVDQPDAAVTVLARTARRLWDHAGAAPVRPGPAVGFTASPLRSSPDVNPMGAGRGYRQRPFAPVVADVTDTGSEPAAINDAPIEHVETINEGSNG